MHSRALYVIVLRSHDSDLSVILNGLKKEEKKNTNEFNSVVS